MKIVLKQQSIRKFLIFLSIFIYFCYIATDIYDFLHKLHVFVYKFLTHVPHKKSFNAFITSSYYYPTSKSLGDNALALVMSVNDEKKPEKWMEMQWWNSVKEPPIRILARNETSSMMVTTKYKRVTPHEICKVMTVFATAQLLPNVKSISMIGDNGLVEIPFYFPSYRKRSVVVCISPLFVSEQWQNFLFAVHIYKKFGAYMNLYLISAVDSFFDLMTEYEKEDYLTIQPWVSVKYSGIPNDVIDAYNKIEFRNQAAAQCDCLLQYKESADFITFLDLDDVLIPRLAPTYSDEFTMFFSTSPYISYIHYHKENHKIDTVRDASKFSFEKMFKSLKYTNARETGKIVVNPENLNYTWIHFPPFMPRGMKKLDVDGNVITHLKTVEWKFEFEEDLLDKLPHFYMNSSQLLISRENVVEIEEDLLKMMRKPQMRSVLSRLPKEHFYADLIGKCYWEKYYYYHYSGRISEIKCPGPQMCEYVQRSDIKCIHVAATYPQLSNKYAERTISQTINKKRYDNLPDLEQLSYFFATDVFFTLDIGCFPH